MIATSLGTYDPDLQMFVEAPRDPDTEIMRMWRKRVQEYLNGTDGEWYATDQEAN